MARRSLLKEAIAGFADAGRRPWLTALLLFSPVSLMFVIAPSQVLLPVLSRDTFGSYTAYGTALACYGAGGLISSVTMMAWRPRRPGVVAVCAMALYALVPLGLDRAGNGAVLLAAAGLVLVIPPGLLLVAGMPHLRGTRTPRTTSGPSAPV
ncbi:hypothetical protein ACWCOT_37370 [Nonomuraea bangladeshensis]